MNISYQPCWCFYLCIRNLLMLYQIGAPFQMNGFLWIVKFHIQKQKWSFINRELLPHFIVKLHGGPFTCILNVRLETYANEDDLINEKLAGFRTKTFYNRYSFLTTIFSQIPISRKKSFFVNCNFNKSQTGIWHCVEKRSVV